MASPKPPFYFISLLSYKKTIAFTAIVFLGEEFEEFVGVAGEGGVPYFFHGVCFDGVFFLDDG